MRKVGSLYKKIYDLNSAYRPVDDVENLTELEDEVLFNLGKLVEVFGLEVMKEILYYLRPDNEEYMEHFGEIQWTKEDILRAISREKEIQRSIRKKGKKKYRTKVKKYFEKWKYRYENYKERNFDPEGILEKDINDLGGSELFFYGTVKRMTEEHHFYNHPDVIIEEAKGRLSRTSFWRFRKLIEEYKKEFS